MGENPLNRILSHLYSHPCFSNKASNVSDIVPYQLYWHSPLLQAKQRVIQGKQNEESTKTREFLT